MFCCRKEVVDLVTSLRFTSLVTKGNHFGFHLKAHNQRVDYSGAYNWGYSLLSGEKKKKKSGRGGGG